MPQLLYLHGFLSSPGSFKAVQVRDWLTQHRPDIRYCCPALTPHPCATRATLTQIMRDAQGPVGVMGSSLGGFWATWLAEQFGVRAVVINPSVNPMALLPQYLHKPVKNFHNDDTYTLTERDLADLAACDTPSLQDPARYWLMVQTGDETLDYRLAVAKYQRCRQTVEAGGDHAFQGFERHIEAAVNFLLPIEEQ
ncbi:YqiA/YcfP family alpha/beta fold hydrolase [Simiduia aestuariiviva]|uniref:Esterase YqiA n=1 Tax=Simiduia aestuariiviva TaxID=1510459 RepID=A0A839UM92_9GAMM|nr:YqiA/YcfP family alpha/beta fold hydrolase [Simiduia aestuariiviva]MBB3166856.1 hypothetical protein [Simiduia aestuariiviva]